MKNMLVLALVSIILFFGCTGGEQKKTGSNVSVEPPKASSTYVVPPNDSSVINQKINDSSSTVPIKPKEIVYTYYSSPLFFIYYPKDWGVDDSNNGIFEFLAPLEDNDDKISEEFVVEIWEGNESTAEGFELLERQLLKPYDIIEKKENVRYKNRDAFVMEVEGKIHDGNEDMFYKTVFFRNGEWIYRLHYAIEKSKLDKYHNIMETILDRFVIGSG